jgi:hypothetical protein
MADKVVTQEMTKSTASFPFWPERWSPSHKSISSSSLRVPSPSELDYLPHRNLGLVSTQVPSANLKLFSQLGFYVLFARVKMSTGKKEKKVIS